MKTKFVIILSVCVFANFFTAQTLVKPSEFSIPATAKFLESKGYKILEQNDSYLKLSNSTNATLFLDLDTEKRYILFNINILLNKGLKKEIIDDYIKEINKLGMIKAEYIEDQNSLGFRYYFWTKDGFTNETLDNAVAEFFLYQGDAYALDKQKIISY